MYEIFFFKLVSHAKYNFTNEIRRNQSRNFLPLEYLEKVPKMKVSINFF